MAAAVALFSSSTGQPNALPSAAEAAAPSQPGRSGEASPPTAPAALGAGSCLFEHPGVSFETFVRVLTNAQTIGSWSFSPREVHLRDGQAYQAQNDGGETHTFTEVAEFGGGFVQELNDLTGNPVPAPECLDFPNIEFIPAGESGTAEADTPGTHKYMCCIHPWMRATVTVR